MSKLTEAAKMLAVECETSDSGEWVRYPCPHGGRRYVIRSRLADGYVTWCEAEPRLVPEWYLDPEAALAREEEEDRVTQAKECVK